MSGKAFAYDLDSAEDFFALVLLHVVFYLPTLVIKPLLLVTFQALFDFSCQLIVQQPPVTIFQSFLSCFIPRLLLKNHHSLLNMVSMCFAIQNAG